MAKRSGAESGAGGASSHRGGAGFAGAGSQSGAGTSKKIQPGMKKVQADRKIDPHSEITTIQYREKLHMAMQKTPHTQSGQNRGPERSDLEPDEQQFESDSETEERLYSEMKGAETGTDRSPKKALPRGPHHNTEPETVAHEGSVSTRTPKRPARGVTSHSAEEESARQQKVVNDRPDAQAGVKHSK